MNKRSIFPHYRYFAKDAWCFLLLISHTSNNSVSASVVRAPEGILPFTPGDYLAKDAKGEWVIWQATIQDKYVKTSEEGTDGFAQYIRMDVSFAAKMPEIFTLDGMRGEQGDYLVINDGSAWPVACEIFEQSYVLVEKAEMEIT